MSEGKDYKQVLKRARQKRGSFSWDRYRCPILAAAAVLIVLLLVAVIVSVISRGRSGREETEAAEAAVRAGSELPQITIPEEELLAAREAEEKQRVVDSYENLGLVQVSGYLNVRREAGPGGDIVGKLMENSACEIIDEEGDWLHIISGGVEGYISSQYVLTGEEARQKAIDYVTRMAIIHADKLNIRREPSMDPMNVTAQALSGERYEVLEEQDGWIHIAEGYISADYATVELALNEARKMDLKAMALSQYDNIVISKVNNYLNIRSDPSMKGDGNVIGKFPGKAAGEILETLDGWYRIRSGSITGYITADPQYVAVGQEATDLAMASASLMAIVKTDMLNVRSEPNTDSKIWTQISREERYPVVTQLDGWVEIELDTGDSDAAGSKAYISTRDNNVEVRYALTEAIKFSPLEEAANKQSSLRSKIVNYALQFVGGRYVWGGTNPNTGADCSGFVQYVMRNAAGISLPRTSREQAKSGKAINSSQMKPGDLIFYTNSAGVVDHVAMYIGNGQVVHAASKRSGIRISTWNYRTPKYIRSFIN
ncbi:MAG: SH3 domain-containing protein [Clostridiales bacterium]|nr:SH3 domain-containing protein [Clostridiales bacterium]